MSRIHRPILTLNLLVGLVSLVTIGCSSTPVSSVPASPSTKPSIAPATESVPPARQGRDSQSPAQPSVQAETIEADDSPDDQPIPKPSKQPVFEQPVLTTTGFMLPSKNIHCMLRAPSDRSSRMALEESFLRCEILSSLNPMPPRPKDGSCDNADWGSGLILSYRKKPSVLCASDSVQSPNHPVIQYGQTWKKHGFTCESSRDGLTCTNPAGNGFSLNREEWQTF